MHVIFSSIEVKSISAHPKCYHNFECNSKNMRSYILKHPSLHKQNLTMCFNKLSTRPREVYNFGFRSFSIAESQSSVTRFFESSRDSSQKLNITVHSRTNSKTDIRNSFLNKQNSILHQITFFNNQFQSRPDLSLECSNPNQSNNETMLPASLQPPIKSSSYSEKRSKASKNEATEKNPNEATKGPWLIVGLGNPERKFNGTRHNVGFEVIDRLAMVENISMSAMQNNAVVGKGKIGEISILLAKPQTYMNLSGHSVAPLANFYKIPSRQVLIIFDDMDLDLGVVKLLAKGGHGGHNGMKSIIESLKGKDFPRLRIGIGKPPGNMPTAAYVLQKFNKNEREEVDVSIEQGVETIQRIMHDGMEKTISMWGIPSKKFINNKIL